MNILINPWRRAAVVMVAVWLAGCGNTPTATDAPSAGTSSTPSSGSQSPPVAAAATPAAPAPAAPPPIVSFDEAVLSAANALLGRAQLPAGTTRHTVLIDPLIDGVTGAQTNASRAMGNRIIELIRERYPQYEVQPFSTSTLSRSPLVLVGTFTGVNKERQTQGPREAFRICLALADLKTGKLVSKGLAFAKPDGVDITPTPFFRDTPVFVEDPATLGYIRTCQGTRVGDPIHPLYLDRIGTAALVNEAIDAYTAGRYADALKLYQTAAGSPTGRQLRVYSGLYLSSLRLGKKDAAAQAFGQIVDQGLETKRLGVKFLFRPGSTAFDNPTEPPAAVAAAPAPEAGPRTRGVAIVGAAAAVSAPRIRPAPVPYPMWIKEISTRAAKLQSCMEVVGHTSASGPEPVNEALSQRRAEQVKTQLVRSAPTLAKRVISNGVGSREPLIGNGRDDLSDALDRRVEFKVIGC